MFLARRVKMDGLAFEEKRLVWNKLGDRDSRRKSNQDGRATIKTGGRTEKQNRIQDQAM